MVVFWIGILIGGLFAFLGTKRGFYETWTTLFNVVVAVYTSILLTPVIVEKIPAAGETAYGNALTLLAIAAAIFLPMHGISFIWLTGQFKVAFPKTLDLVGAGILGFLKGVLIWSFIAVLISSTPLGQKDSAERIGFGSKIEQTNGRYVCLWCGLIDTVTASGDNRRSARESISFLLEKTAAEPGRSGTD